MKPRQRGVKALKDDGSGWRVVRLSMTAKRHAACSIAETIQRIEKIFHSGTVAGTAVTTELTKLEGAIAKWIGPG